jgi:Ig-like domain from next to BRCA1 gene
LLNASAIIRRVLTRRKLSRDWPRQVATIAVALTLALAGCSPTTATPTPFLPPDNASPTPPVLPVVTSTPIPLPTDTPTEALTATLPEGASASDTPAVSLATGTPSPTPGGPCTNNLHFIADVTVPDGTQYLPGQPIDKQWRVKNTGTCDWGADYRLVLVSGNAMGAPSEVALYPAKGGSAAVLELNMIAPPDPGTYTGRWQARSPSAKLFGDRVFVTINVIAITTTVTITATP